MNQSTLTWFGIFRLGLVQTALGAIVVLTTSTLNRVLVVEYMLPAMLPGALVALHYAIQITRPRFGYGSDVGGRRTPWILGGMAVLAIGGVLAAIGTAMAETNLPLGIAVLVFSFIMIGMGVGAAGTSLLVLLAKQVDSTRRAAAASLVWFMMILGFAVTAGIAGHFLDPFTPQRLILISSVISIIAFCTTIIAVFRLEKANNNTPESKAMRDQKPPFFEALTEVWADPKARHFTIFIFVSMLAYSAQDLILEPFAGTVFAMTPGESTQLSGLQHGGVLVGMILVALAGLLAGKNRFSLLKTWTVAGCICSGFVLFVLAYSGISEIAWSLHAIVFSLGVTTGAFAVAAIGSMMALVTKGPKQREGVRMGLWGASQAIAFCVGGFLGTVAIDVTRFFLESASLAYSIVFVCEGLLFLIAAQIASNIQAPEEQGSDDYDLQLVGDSDFIKLDKGL